MTGYTMTVTLDRPYDDVVPEVRDALAGQGFGVLTEIDVRATMKAKLDVDVPAQVILGVCRPQLEDSPVVREVADEARTRLQAALTTLDPAAEVP